MSSPRRVLVVSFFYPPDPAIGGRRVQKFVEYLPDFGWEPVVLTANTGGGPGFETAEVHATRYLSPWKAFRDGGEGELSSRPRLRERSRKSSRLARAAYTALRHLAPMSSVRMPDATLGWIPYAVAEGHRLVEAQRFDALLSSAGPPSSHMVAARIQRRAPLPWIADYRDLWSGNHWDYRVPPFRWLERQLERRVVARASGMTTVSPDWAARLQELHRGPVEVIYNGFDPSDYPARRERTGAAAFVLTYVGTLYWPGQNPEPLFAALARLERDAQAELERVRFKLRFLGTQAGLVDTLAEKYGIQSRVQRLDAVSYHQSLALQQESTALLFLGWRDPAEGFLTAKIFEYLGAERPILAVGPAGGTTSQLLKDCGHSDTSADPDVIAATLKSWIDEHLRTGRVQAPSDASSVARFTRRAQTERLAGLLERASRR